MSYEKLKLILTTANNEKIHIPVPDMQCNVV